MVGQHGAPGDIAPGIDFHPGPVRRFPFQHPFGRGTLMVPREGIAIPDIVGNEGEEVVAGKRQRNIELEEGMMEPHVPQPAVGMIGRLPDTVESTEGTIIDMELRGLESPRRTSATHFFRLFPRLFRDKRNQIRLSGLNAERQGQRDKN